MTESWHGKPVGYAIHKCRCGDCRGAHARRSAEYRRKRYAGRTLVDGNLIHPAATHGTRGAYLNYGCRCVECKRAVKRGAA